MEYSTDPYEFKLYQMFQSCDTKQCGFLDEQSLRRLCGLLELRDKGAVLIDNLSSEGRTSHVTFENFKEALLTFLGTELDGANTTEFVAEQRKHQQHLQQQQQYNDKGDEIVVNCGGKLMKFYYKTFLYMFLL